MIFHFIENALVNEQDQGLCYASGNGMKHCSALQNSVSKYEVRCCCLYECLYECYSRRLRAELLRRSLRFEPTFTLSHVPRSLPGA